MRFVIQVGYAGDTIYLGEGHVWHKIPAKALGFPNEVAAMQAFLASESAKVVVLDGEPDQK